MTGCLFSPSQPFLSSVTPAPSAHPRFPFFCKAKREHTQKQSLSPFCSTLYHSAAWGAVFGWSTLIAMGHSLSLALRSKKKKKIQAFSFIKLAPARLQPQRTTVSFFFSFPPTLPVLFVFSSTNNCHVHKSQEGAAICYSSNLFNNTSNSR